jgi:hypothetical protein
VYKNSITGLTNTVIQDDFDETLPYVLDFSKFYIGWTINGKVLVELDLVYIT